MFYIMCIAVNTLDTNAAYHLSEIRLFGCKDTAEKTVPSVFIKKPGLFCQCTVGRGWWYLSWSLSAHRSKFRVMACLVWIRGNGVTARVHRHMYGGCYVIEINGSTALWSLAFVLKQCNQTFIMSKEDVSFENAFFLKKISTMNSV